MYQLFGLTMDKDSKIYSIITTILQVFAFYYIINIDLFTINRNA